MAAHRRSLQPALRRIVFAVAALVSGAAPRAWAQYQVIVDPKNSSANAPANSSNSSVSFTVHNMVTDGTTYYVELYCTGATGNCTTTNYSFSYQAGASIPVTFATTVAGSGRVRARVYTLTYPATSDSGWYNVTVLPPYAVAVTPTTWANAIDNPDCAVDAVGWAGAWGSETIIQDSWGCKVTTINQGGSGHWHLLRNGSRVPAAAGQSYTYRLWVNADAAATGKTFFPGINWWSTTAYISYSRGPAVTLVSGWQRVTFTATAPAGTASSQPIFTTTDALGVFNYWAKGAVFTVQAVAPQRMAGTGGYSAVFTVQNTGYNTDTYSLDCLNSANVSCTRLSLTTVSLAPGASATDTAYYNVGAAGTGTLTVRARGTYPVADTGSYGVPVVVPQGAPVVDATPISYAKQDYQMCASACFALTTTRATVPYFSLDLPRNVILAYNGDRVSPQPFVLINVSPDTTYSSRPTQYQLQVKVKWDGVTPTVVTFLNGEQTLNFAYPGNTMPVRIGGQFAAAGRWGVFPMDIVVSAYYASGALLTNAITTKLIVLDQTGGVARGWNVGGVQRLWQQNDGSALLVEGNGSAVYFANSSGSFASPAGEFSQLVTSTLSGSAGWARLFPDSTKVVFNSAGLMTQVLDRFGNRDSVVYDASNRVSKILDPLNLALTLTYGSYGLATIQDPWGRVTNVTVDASGRLTAMTDPDNVGTGFGYDGSLRLSAITNRNGATASFGYDAQAGTLASVTAPSVAFYDGTSGSPVTTYSAWQKVAVPYSPTSSSWFNPPQPSAVKASISEPGGAAVQFTVNRWGAAAQVADPLGRITTTTYDANGLPIKVVHPSGAVDSAAYNSSGLLTFAQSADTTNQRFIHYASWAEPDSAWGGPQPAMRAFLGVNGRIDSVRTGGSSTRRYVYDNMGRIVSSTDPQGHFLGRRWYAGVNGNHSRDSTPGGWITAYYYDAFGRDTAVVGPTGHMRRMHYDLLNRQVQYYDGGYSTPTTTAYDSSSNVASVTDERGQIYRFAYNSLGWLIRRTDPLGNTDTLKYSRDGDLMRRVNRRGQTISYAYDALHRDTSKTGTNTDADRWNYSTNGLVIVATSPVSTETAYLNVRGQADSVSTVIAGQTFWRRYHYTSIGLLDSMAVTGGGIAFRARKYTYNLNMFTVSGIRLGAASAGTTSRQYNADLQKQATTYRGGEQVSLQYDPHNRVGSSGTNAPYQNYVNQVLSYDGEGRLNSVIDSTGTTGFRFTYDALGRLASDSAIAAPGPPPSDCMGFPPPIIGDNGSICTSSTTWTTAGGVQYSYDSVGNRLDRGGAYGTGNRITAFGGCSYGTDADGNVTSRSCAAQAVTLKWTAEAHLDTVVVGGQTIGYYYDPRGRLVRKDVNGAAQSYFLWDGSILFAELNGSATGEVAEYSFYPGMDNPHAVVVGGVEYEVQTDALGNVVVLTDSSQSTKRTYAYDDWGNLTGGTDALPFTGVDRLRWRGALWLGNEANLYYMRNRWYEPQTGRFLSEDPTGLSGVNVYAFGGDDPINKADPFGTDGDCLQIDINEIGAPVPCGGNSGGPDERMWDICLYPDSPECKDSEQRHSSDDASLECIGSADCVADPAYVEALLKSLRGSTLECLGSADCQADPGFLADVYSQATHWPHWYGDVVGWDPDIPDDPLRAVGGRDPVTGFDHGDPGVWVMRFERMTRKVRFNPTLPVVNVPVDAAEYKGYFQGVYYPYAVEAVGYVYPNGQAIFTAYPGRRCNCVFPLLP